MSRGQRRLRRRQDSQRLTQLSAEHPTRPEATTKNSLVKFHARRHREGPNRAELLHSRGRHTCLERVEAQLNCTARQWQWRSLATTGRGDRVWENARDSASYIGSLARESSDLGS